MWPLDAQMEAESLAAEGKGDNVSVGTEGQGQGGPSGSQEVMDVDEEAHPNENRELKGQTTQRSSYLTMRFLC